MSETARFFEELRLHVGSHKFHERYQEVMQQLQEKQIKTEASA
jgi:hypothetical protein